MKSEFDTIKELYRYNSLVRKKYIQAIWKLPPRQRYRSRGASYPTIVDIYMHVLDAYRWWFISVYAKGKKFEEYPLGQRYTKSEAARETATVDRLLQKVIREVGPRGLSKILYWRGKRPFRISVRNMLLHMMEEELQHRGEMNALLWQIDIDPPVTGFGER
ncbi:MAG: DinB family protein [Thermoplasmata archaeon]